MFFCRAGRIFEIVRSSIIPSLLLTKCAGMTSGSQQIFSHTATACARRISRDIFCSRAPPDRGASCARPRSLRWRRSPRWSLRALSPYSLRSKAISRYDNGLPSPSNAAPSVLPSSFLYSPFPDHTVHPYKLKFVRMRFVSARAFASSMSGGRPMMRTPFSFPSFLR